ncbi:MAG TPA: glutamine-hydrolyzing carbamoyl-phosphate synthase small subunit [Acidimicrobiales bacterium]|nr:glutamine-hydrolyzing carbamoyl-phosphate synthase small subunit [Acidimicrobiales bacterium]
MNRSLSPREREPSLLVLADGEVFEGESIGFEPPGRISTGELVFNTALSGYQEILTDPSYAGQVVAFTYPHIGNYGTNDVDQEAKRPWCRGLVARDVPPRHSNWRAELSLEDFMLRQGLAGIVGVDTRRLTRHLRNYGAMSCAFGTAGEAELLRAAEAEPGTSGKDLVSEVSVASPYVRGSGQFRVVAYDFGVKETMLRCLGELATVTVVPAAFAAEEALALDPHGVFLSNGPGDPAALTKQAQIISDLLGRVPIFGICLGHQLLATAAGGRTHKLPFGHHGGNHPVQHVGSGRVEITSQNHNYAVEPGSIGTGGSTNGSESSRRSTGIQVTHVNLNDGVIEGIAIPRAAAFSVQYHPEAGPGPHDARYLFEEFEGLMRTRSLAGGLSSRLSASASDGNPPERQSDRNVSGTTSSTKSGPKSGTTSSTTSQRVV